MDKQQIFENVLTREYNHANFVNFAQEFLSDMQISPNHSTPRQPSEKFSELVKEFYYIGNYSAGNDNLFVLTIVLQKNKSVEQARVLQRNFVREILGENATGAIAAFYAEDAPEKWRLSFVRLTFEFIIGKGGKIKITPAKRFSYIVGIDEPCATAMQQLFPLFVDDYQNFSLDELEAAFGVERVTQEFFDNYKEKFFVVKEYLETNAEFIEEAAGKFTAEQFAKKLLGQIVFLYFLQKKGWLGVDPAAQWGTGATDFLRKLFKTCTAQSKNFFDDYLEPLFYTALNIDRKSDNDIYERLQLRIPFLNGGLFEEMEGYHWQHNNFRIPNEIFSNSQNNGVLDIFDRYNFTIYEAEMREHEVAVDPEMLGKVFENLLEIHDRKSKGAYYTPREIVSYMCRESLINYLVERSQIPLDAVKHFITYGDSADLPQEISIRADFLDDILADIKVADLATGSGAFLLGMLIEIVHARAALNNYLKVPAARSSYDLKIETIKNSIFACDIEPSAVDIAKLRLWLSIVIDDTPKPDDKNFSPKQLPNLESNIICGNSLIDEFNGVKLIKTSKFLNNEKGGQTSLLQNEFDINLLNIIAWQDKLFFESNHDQKEIIRRHLRELYNDTVIKQIKENPALVKAYEVAAKKKPLPFVIWQLYFPTVFRGRGGFDIIIGNPPYGAKTSDADKKIFKKNFLCTKTVTGKQKGSVDTFALFIEKGFNLCAKNGIVNFIVPMSVTSSDSMTALHNLLEKNCKVIKVSSYSCRPKQIFNAACVNTAIISFVKSLTPFEKLLTSKLMRRSEGTSIGNIIERLNFVDSKKYKLPGRYPKIGTPQQFEIIKKMFDAPKKLSDYQDDKGKPFYYRSSGGRYFNVITDYPSGSSKEKPYVVKAEFTKVIGALLSTSLFWFYQQVYTNGLDLKQVELDTLPLFELEKLPAEKISLINKLYDEYLADIEKNVAMRRSSMNSSYNVATFKNYNIWRSKDLADKLDDIIDELYGLDASEIDFIKNFEKEFRMGDNELEGTRN